MHVFLSVDAPEKGEPGFDTADRQLIQNAVNELSDSVLGRRPIVTQRADAFCEILLAALDKRLDPNKWVICLENREKLEKFLADNDFKGGVFIGGGSSMRDDYEMFSETNQYYSNKLPVPSPGGVAREIWRERGMHKWMEHSVDFIGMYCSFLDVDITEPLETVK